LECLPLEAVKCCELTHKYGYISVDKAAMARALVSVATGPLIGSERRYPCTNSYAIKVEDNIPKSLPVDGL
jgi:hypothetical protein